MQLNIVAIGSYYQHVDPDLPPADLKQTVQAYCRERYRRIDRYIQLALIGAGRCSEKQNLDADTGLYVGSRFASINNATQLQERLLKHGEIPKPANFINTLSNTGGYYVARNLGLSSRNLFVSRADASIFAALQLAQLDLGCKAVKRALVGVVDEVGLPTWHHCQRLGVAPDTPLGEGSHWFLVQHESTAASLATISSLEVLATNQGLQGWLLHQMANGDKFYWFATPAARNFLSTRHSDTLPQHAFYDPGLHYYPGMLAGAISRYLSDAGLQPLLVIDLDQYGRFHVARVQRTG